MKIGLNPVLSAARPSNVTSSTSVVTCVQVSMTLLYRSPSVMRPLRYCFMIVSTSTWAFSMIFAFSGGTRMSSMPTVMPARVA
jgi:hypothetical protein